MKLPTRRCSAVFLALTMAALVASNAGIVAARPASQQAAPAPEILASNAFYYYADVEAAWRFYSDVLGFETAADYGFAKIMRVAPASYLTLVEAARGMHSAEEPKTATLAIVTDEVEQWFEHLQEHEVPMRHELGEVDPEAAHVGFVAVDPEGYLLEFERFQPHPENDELLPLLESVEPLYPGTGALTSRPAHLGVRGIVQWLYFADTEATLDFYGRVLGEPALLDQGWAWAFQVSASGFLGIVDGARGLHSATEEKGVTMSFIVSDIEAWYDRLRGINDFEWRSDAIGDESGLVRVFVGYDPEGYFLEWDEFLDLEGNENLIPALRAARATR